MGRPRRLQNGLSLHAWRIHQDTKILSSDGSCLFYLERPLTAGRLDYDWNYKLQLGDKSSSTGTIVMTIKRQETKCEGLSCQVVNLFGADSQIVTSLRWLGDAKKARTGKASGTKKYMFDWQGREWVWDSVTTFAGTDHFCCDTGGGEVLCYFKSIFWPLEKDGKIEISSKVADETTRTVLVASCMAYREWADKRETGVYIT